MKYYTFSRRNQARTREDYSYHDLVKILFNYASPYVRFTREMLHDAGIISGRYCIAPLHTS